MSEPRRRTLGVLGRGRAARSLVPLWQAAGQHVSWWWSLGDAGNPASLAPVDTVVLCVPDAAIEAAAASLAARPAATEEIWLHLSGSRPAAVARVSATAPRAAGCLHPLIALTGAPDPSRVTGARAGLDGDPDACVEADRLARLLGLVPIVLTPGTKALYHAAAVSVAGHATALFAQATALLTRCGFTTDDARAALQPLLAGAAANLRDAPAADAITGPIARGDVGTVRAHLQALDATDPHAAATYRQLAATALELSHDALSPADAAALDALLSAAPAPR